MTITDQNIATDEVVYFLRLKGMATDEALAAMLGVGREAARGRADELVAAGLAVRRETPRLSGTMLSPEGRSRSEAVLAALRDAPEVAVFRQTLDEFLPVNSDFKNVCVRWQSRGDGQANAHDDPDYDAAVIDALGAVHDRVGPLLSRSAASVPRLARYASRLDGAMARVREGEVGAMLRPMSESYHDIWMELHQDLINSSGRERDESDES